MRGEFHPEWGYLAPAPSFVHRARVVLVATAVGATVGAGVVFSRVSHTATETSVAARTLVGPVGATSARGGALHAALTDRDSPSVSPRCAFWHRIATRT